MRSPVVSPQIDAREISFPVPTNLTRDDLLQAVAEIAPVLAEECTRADIDGQLSPSVVKLLRSTSLWRMRLCGELGGLELPIVDQIQVLAALAAEDSSSAWCTMVANNAVAVLGASMPDAAVSQVFADGPPACSIVAGPGGRAVRVAGGYQVNGTWRLASGIHNAAWIHATAHIDGDPSRVLPLALPRSDVAVLDTWHVVGLAGTGSNDFSVTDYFLPESLTGRESNPYGQLRGTRRYDRVGLEHLETYEHLAFAVGVGRRVLRELRSALASGTAGRHTADREVVQSELGHAFVQLRAVEAAAMAVFGKVDAAASGETTSWSQADRYLPRAMAAWATKLALDTAQLAFQRSGASALHRPNVLEKLLRDMSVAATHIMVDDSSLASYGQHLIETSPTLQSRRT